MYETQHRNVPHKKTLSYIPNTYITTHKMWVTFTFHSPLVWKLTDLFCNTNLKIAFWSIHKLLCIQTNNTITKHQSGMSQMKCQTCKHSRIGQIGRKLEVDTKSTFAMSRLTTHSQPMPVTFSTVHVNMTLLQLVQKGRHLNILQNYFIQLFQYSNMIINEQTLKERNQLFELIYNLQLCQAYS